MSEHANSSHEQVEAHYERLAAFVRTFLQGQPSPQMTGRPLIPYSLFGTTVFYMANREVIEAPLEPGDLVDAVKGHLGVEWWDALLRLKPLSQAHLTQVKSLWREMTDSVYASGRKVGLVPVERFSPEDVDFFWPALFVEAVWKELAGVRERQVLTLTQASVVQELVMVSMRHTLDEVNTWVIQGTNMARSQSKDSVDSMMKVWKELLDDSAPKVKGVYEERASISASGGMLVSEAQRVLLDYKLTSRFPGKCKFCS